MSNIVDLPSIIAIHPPSDRYLARAGDGCCFRHTKYVVAVDAMTEWNPYATPKFCPSDKIMKALTISGWKIVRINDDNSRYLTLKRDGDDIGFDSPLVDELQKLLVQAQEVFDGIVPDPDRAPVFMPGACPAVKKQFGM